MINFASLVSTVRKAIKPELKAANVNPPDDVQAFLAAGGTIKHFPNARFSIAYFPDRSGRQGKIYRVSTSICHPNDAFSRKIGARALVTALSEGNQVLMTAHMIETLVSYYSYTTSE